VLAAIIMTAVFGLIDLQEVRHLWKVKRGDLALLGITFVATLLLGIEEGILVGVGASLLWFIFRSTTPHYAVLGRLPGTETYRNIQRHPQAERLPGVLALRIDSQFYFGNVSFLKETLAEEEANLDEPLRAFVLDASSINQLDSSADTALRQVLEDYQDRGIPVYLAGTKGPVLDVMKRSGLWYELGSEHFTHDVHGAMQSVCEEIGTSMDDARPSDQAAAAA
jgi:SulP family sulfate permease